MHTGLSLLLSFEDVSIPVCKKKTNPETLTCKVLNA